MPGAINTTMKNGNEHFIHNGQNLKFLLKDFWGWGFSQLLTNNLRGILAEFVIATAIGKTDSFREERDSWDLITKEGVKIEVKSASYIQSREQKKLSHISFSIRPTHGYNITLQKREDVKNRQSDIYVFCLLKEKDKDKVNPLNMDHRDFFILPTSFLDKIPQQKTITLNKLQTLGATRTNYNDIYPTIKTLFNSH